MNTQHGIEIHDKGVGNNVQHPTKFKFRKGIKVIFKGSNNTLEIGEGAFIVNARFDFQGDNAKIIIGKNCKLNGSFIVRENCLIKIGEHTKFNNQTSRLHCGEPNTSIIIGKSCLFANVRFRTSDQHAIINKENNLRINKAANIEIKDRVWLAEDVYVYKGVVIEEGSVVGARSTVTKSLPAYHLCVGSPAIPVKSNITWEDRV